MPYPQEDPTAIQRPKSVTDDLAARLESVVTSRSTMFADPPAPVEAPRGGGFDVEAFRSTFETPTFGIGQAELDRYGGSTALYVYDNAVPFAQRAARLFRSAPPEVQNVYAGKYQQLMGEANTYLAYKALMEMGEGGDLPTARAGLAQVGNLFGALPQGAGAIEGLLGTRRRREYTQVDPQTGAPVMRGAEDGELPMGELLSHAAMAIHEMDSKGLGSRIPQGIRDAAKSYGKWAQVGGAARTVGEFMVMRSAAKAAVAPFEQAKGMIPGLVKQTVGRVAGTTGGKFSSAVALGGAHGAAGGAMEAAFGPGLEAKLEAERNEASPEDIARYGGWDNYVREKSKDLGTRWSYIAEKMGSGALEGAISMAGWELGVGAWRKLGKAVGVVTPELTKTQEMLKQAMGKEMPGVKAAVERAVSGLTGTPFVGRIARGMGHGTEWLAGAKGAELVTSMFFGHPEPAYAELLNEDPLVTFLVGSAFGTVNVRNIRGDLARMKERLTGKSKGPVPEATATLDKMLGSMDRYTRAATEQLRKQGFSDEQLIKLHLEMTEKGDVVGQRIADFIRQRTPGDLAAKKAKIAEELSNLAKGVPGQNGVPLQLPRLRMARDAQEAPGAEEMRGQGSEPLGAELPREVREAAGVQSREEAARILDDVWREFPETAQKETARIPTLDAAKKAARRLMDIGIPEDPATAREWRDNLDIVQKVLGPEGQARILEEEYGTARRQFALQWMEQRRSELLARRGMGQTLTERELAGLKFVTEELRRAREVGDKWKAPEGIPYPKRFEGQFQFRKARNRPEPSWRGRKGFMEGPPDAPEAFDGEPGPSGPPRGLGGPGAAPGGAQATVEAPFEERMPMAEAPAAAMPEAAAAPARQPRTIEVTAEDRARAAEVLRAMNLRRKPSETVNPGDLEAARGWRGAGEGQTFARGKDRNVLDLMAAFGWPEAKAEKVWAQLQAERMPVVGPEVTSRRRQLTGPAPRGEGISYQDTSGVGRPEPMKPGEVYYIDRSGGVYDALGSAVRGAQKRVSSVVNAWTVPGPAQIGRDALPRGDRAWEPKGLPSPELIRALRASGLLPKERTEFSIVPPKEEPAAAVEAIEQAIEPYRPAMEAVKPVPPPPPAPSLPRAKKAKVVEDPRLKAEVRADIPAGAVRVVMAPRELTAKEANEDPAVQEITENANAVLNKIMEVGRTGSAAEDIDVIQAIKTLDSAVKRAGASRAFRYLMRNGGLDGSQFFDRAVKSVREFHKHDKARGEEIIANIEPARPMVVEAFRRMNERNAALPASNMPTVNDAKLAIEQVAAVLHLDVRAISPRSDGGFDFDIGLHPAIARGTRRTSAGATESIFADLAPKFLQEISSRWAGGSTWSLGMEAGVGPADTAQFGFEALPFQFGAMRKVAPATYALDIYRAEKTSRDFAGAKGKEPLGSLSRVIRGLANKGSQVIEYHEIDLTETMPERKRIAQTEAFIEETEARIEAGYERSRALSRFAAAHSAALNFGVTEAGKNKPLSDFPPMAADAKEFGFDGALASVPLGEFVSHFRMLEKQALKEEGDARTALDTFKESLRKEKEKASSPIGIRAVVYNAKEARQELMEAKRQARQAEKEAKLQAKLAAKKSPLTGKPVKAEPAKPLVTVDEVTQAFERYENGGDPEKLFKVLSKGRKNPEVLEHLKTLAARDDIRWDPRVREYVRTLVGARPKKKKGSELADAEELATGGRDPKPEELEALRGRAEALVDMTEPPAPQAKAKKRKPKAETVQRETVEPVEEMPTSPSAKAEAEALPEVQELKKAVLGRLNLDDPHEAGTIDRALREPGLDSTAISEFWRDGGGWFAKASREFFDAGLIDKMPKRAHAEAARKALEQMPDEWWRAASLAKAHIRYARYEEVRGQVDYADVGFADLVVRAQLQNSNVMREYIDRAANMDPMSKSGPLKHLVRHELEAAHTAIVELAKRRGWLKESENGSGLVPSPEMQALAQVVEYARWKDYGYKRKPPKRDWIPTLDGDNGIHTRRCSDCTLGWRRLRSLAEKEKWEGPLRRAGILLARIFRSDNRIGIPWVAAEQYAKEFTAPEAERFRKGFLAKSILTLRNRFGDVLGSMASRWNDSKLITREKFYSRMKEAFREYRDVPEIWEVKSPAEITDPVIRGKAMELEQIADALEGTIKPEALGPRTRAVYEQAKGIYDSARELLADHVFRKARRALEVAIEGGIQTPDYLFRAWKRAIGDDAAARDPKVALQRLKATIRLRPHETETVAGMKVRGWGLRDYFPHVWPKTPNEGANGLNWVAHPSNQIDGDDVVVGKPGSEHAGEAFERWRVQLARNFGREHGFMSRTRWMRNLMERLENKDGYVRDARWVMRSYLGQMIDKVYHERLTDDLDPYLFGRYVAFADKATDVAKVQSMLQKVPTWETNEARGSIGGIDEYFSIKASNLLAAGKRFVGTGEGGWAEATPLDASSAAERTRLAGERWRWVRSQTRIIGDPSEWTLALATRTEMFKIKGLDAMRRAGIEIRDGGTQNFTTGESYHAIKEVVRELAGYDMDTGKWDTWVEKNSAFARVFMRASEAVNNFIYQAVLGGSWLNPKAFMVQFFEGSFANAANLDPKAWAETVKDMEGSLSFYNALVHARNPARDYEAIKASHANTAFVRKVLPVLEAGQWRPWHLLQTDPMNIGAERPGWLGKFDAEKEVWTRRSLAGFTIGDVMTKVHNYYAAHRRAAEVKEWTNPENGRTVKVIPDYIQPGDTFTHGLDVISAHDIARMSVERTHFTLPRWAQPGLMRMPLWSVVGHLGTQATNITFEFFNGLREATRFVAGEPDANLWRAQAAGRYFFGMLIAFHLAAFIGRDIGDYTGAHISDVGIGPVTLGSVVPQTKALPYWARAFGYQLPRTASLPMEFWFGREGVGVPATLADAGMRATSGTLGPVEAAGTALDRWWRNWSPVMGLGPGTRGTRPLLNILGGGVQHTDVDPDRPWEISDISYFGRKKRLKYRGMGELVGELLFPGRSYPEAEEFHRARATAQQLGARGKIASEIRRDLTSQDLEVRDAAVAKLREMGINVQGHRVRRMALAEKLTTAESMFLQLPSLYDRSKFFIEIAADLPRERKARLWEAIMGPGKRLGQFSDHAKKTLPAELKSALIEATR